MVVDYANIESIHMLSLIMSLFLPWSGVQRWAAVFIVLICLTLAFVRNWYTSNMIWHIKPMVLMSVWTKGFMNYKNMQWLLFFCQTCFKCSSVLHMALTMQLWLVMFCRFSHFRNCMDHWTVDWNLDCNSCSEGLCPESHVCPCPQYTCWYWSDTGQQSDYCLV